jgi:hypothetical protein
VERLVVDDDCAILEGFLKQIYLGAVAVGMGMADDPKRRLSDGFPGHLHFRTSARDQAVA